MKITLTLAEVHAIIATKLGIDNFELDIISPSALDPDVARFFEAMAPFVTHLGNIRPDKKIAAIKQFREFFLNPYYDATVIDSRKYLTHLAVAKRAIEDWWNFSANVREANRMPTIAGDDWTF
jgi:hypothetical protein